MRRSVTLLCGIVGLALALPLVAQEKPANIGRVFVTIPKPGYEEGRKRHMDWHRKQNDTWTWETWQVETGETAGAFLTITLGHKWKDFDDWAAKYGEGDTADGAKNLSPYVAGGSNAFWVYRADISRPSDSKESPKMLEVIHFMVKSEGMDEFNLAIRRINEAIGKTNWPTHYNWHQLVNGGETPHLVLVLPLNSWADMAGPDVTFDAMLEKGLGRQESAAVLRSLRKSIHREWSEILVYRPDLSYRPGAK